MPDYDSTKESNYITYLDANNLYRQNMSQYFPIGNFRWLTMDRNYKIQNIFYI